MLRQLFEMRKIELKREGNDREILIGKYHLKNDHFKI